MNPYTDDDAKKQSWTEDEIKKLFFEQLQNLVDKFGMDHVMDKMNSGKGFCLSREEDLESPPLETIMEVSLKVACSFSGKQLAISGFHFYLDEGEVKNPI